MPNCLAPCPSPLALSLGRLVAYEGRIVLQAVLSGSGKCPFTQRPLAWEQCQILTKGNIERYKGRIIADKELLQKFGLS